MEATIVGLRYRTKEVLKALERNEEVDILCHGKLKGTIKPAHRKAARKACDHPFFDMSAGECSVPAVQEEMEGLRGGRYRGL